MNSGYFASTTDTASGTNKLVLTLADSGVTAGTYQGLTVDAKGRVTAAEDKGYAVKANVDTELAKKLDKAGGSVTGNLTIGGNLTVNGTTTSIDSTTLKVSDKLIEVAKDNTVKLTTPAGIVVPNYDGRKYGALVIDGDGNAQVGDVELDASGNIDVTNSDLQILATRDGLTDGNLVKWDNTKKTLVPDTTVASDASSALSKANANATEISTIKTTYQTKTDASLETTDKTVVGAINEVVTGVAGTLESFGMSLAPQENGKLNKKVYVFPDGSLASGTSYDASKDLYLSIGDGLTLETIDEENNIWNIKSGSAITSVDGLGGGAISGDVSTSGSLTVGGSLTVNGTTTTVDSTTLQVKDKLIEVAHGNTTKLTTPAGLVAPKYDGANSGALVFDGDGTAYVGDVKLDSTGNIDVAKSELQPLATRTGLVDGNLVQYDSTAQTLKDSGKKISDLATTSQVNAKYTKPSGGIPKTDLASDVQTSLGKADTALQSAPVTSVNGKTGAVQLGASDVGALPSSTKFVSSVNGKTGAVTGLATQDEVNAKQNTLTETQLAAVNSGVTQAKITKYDGYDATIKQKVNVSDLATVATSGSYNDLKNTPTIPTVNNGTLTIQKNGTTVATFSANQSGNATANITVPTFSLSGTTLTITL